MTDLPRATRLKRIHMRATHRGMKEMDVILGRFSEGVVADLSDAELDLLERMMEENDQEIYTWVTGRNAPPAEFSALIDQIARHVGAR